MNYCDSCSRVACNSLLLLVTNTSNKKKKKYKKKRLGWCKIVYARRSMQYLCLSKTRPNYVYAWIGHQFFTLWKKLLAESQFSDERIWLGFCHQLFMLLGKKLLAESSFNCIWFCHQFHYTGKKNGWQNHSFPINA